MKSIEQLVPSSELQQTKVAVGTSLTAITDNSEKVTPGAVFFAVRGTRSDGHRFIPQALARGASAIVVEEASEFPLHPHTILVSSSRLALARAACRWYDEPTQRLHLVGVTGTNGKTTTTYLLKSLWSGLAITSGIIGTVEYQIGTKREPSRLTTPDALGLQSLFSQMVSAGVTHAAMEVSSIALDQFRVGGSQFEVALFTNLTQDHLDYHADFESYYQAKRRLFLDYPLRVGAVNLDDPWGRRLYQELPSGKRLGFSLSQQNSDFSVQDPVFSKAGTKAIVQTPAGIVPLFSPLIGKHNLYNTLGALTVAYALGQDLRVAAQALESAPGAPGRLERVMIGTQYPNIFVDYAHTEDALLNVLRALSELKGQQAGRIFTVFGCGGDRDRSKRSHMAEVASSWSDVTIATSDNPRTEDPDRIVDDVEQGIRRDKTRYHRETNRREAIYWALAQAGPEDIVLVAGKGHETYQIIGHEQFPFDDREVIRDYYRGLLS